jgi:hypothetical protein
MHTVIKHNEKNKHYLMLCELHYPAIHGKDSGSNPYIERHFLVNDRFDSRTGISYQCLDDDEEYDTDNEYESDNDNEDNNYRVVKPNEVMEFLKEHYSNPANFNPRYFGNHPTIRNYHNIISRPNYIKPEIGEYILLPTQEAVAILKTVWLRIIQRKWKKVFAERQNIIKYRCYPSSLREREIYGKWPQICSNLPGLKGMLKDLKK